MSSGRLILAMSGLVILFLASAGLAEVMLVPGDVDGDGMVGAEDLRRVNLWWGYPDRTRAYGDLTGDGLVNGADYIEVVNNWGKFWEPMPEDVTAQLYPVTVEPAPIVQPIGVQPIRISPIRITVVKIPMVGVAGVPEPGTIGLILFGGLAGLIRRR